MYEQDSNWIERKQLTQGAVRFDHANLERV